jgi:phosphinothricin tripeptide acetyl hydrolase
MASPQYEKLLGILWAQPRPDGDHPIEERRSAMDQLALPLADDVSATLVDIDGMRAEWVTAAGAGEHRVVLYLHGGGYVIGSPRSHRHLAAAIAGAAATDALLLDYRLAPEHPFPAALDDAVAAYRWLLDQGILAEHIAVAGDSAGGGLTVATLLALRDAHLPRPAAGVCISPWVDLTCSGGSYQSKAGVDPIVRQAGVAEMARAYLGATDPRSPLASPLFADLRGLPPLLIHVGSDEVLLDDAIGLAERAKAAAVDATLEQWDRMIHVWHWFLPMLDEAQAAVESIGSFVRARMV